MAITISPMRIRPLFRISLRLVAFRRSQQPHDKQRQDRDDQQKQLGHGDVPTRLVDALLMQLRNDVVCRSEAQQREYRRFPRR